MDIKRLFSESDWLATPKPVREYIKALEQAIVEVQSKTAQHDKRIAQREKRVNKDSQNSNKPPSSDSPYRLQPREKTKKKKRKKRGGPKGHKGHRQQLLEPGRVINI